MIDKFCEYLTNKIRNKMPDIDDERAEVIQFGIQLIFGEIPKFFLMFGVGIILGLWYQTLLAFFLILPYKVVSGGVHLKSHLGCILMTNLVYCGNAALSEYLVVPYYFKIILVLINIILGLIFITKYAPADTENMPILRKKERKTKKILSYMFLMINMIVAIFIPYPVVSNILLFGTLMQTLSVTSIAYKLAKNKYGYINYIKEKENFGQA